MADVVGEDSVEVYLAIEEDFVEVREEMFLILL
jgi:hypothetical protein